MDHDPDTILEEHQNVQSSITPWKSLENLTFPNIATEWHIDEKNHVSNSYEIYR